MNKQDQLIALHNLKLIKKLFDEEGIHHWLDLGTALCAYRDGDLEHEHDTDIGVFVEDFPKIEKLENKLNELYKNTLGWFVLKGKYPIYTSWGLESENIVHGDIIYWHSIEVNTDNKIENYKYCHGVRLLYSLPEKLLHNFSKVSFKNLDKDNTQFNIPGGNSKETEEYLEYCFGDWKTKMTSKEYEDMQYKILNNEVKSPLVHKNIPEVIELKRKMTSVFGYGKTHAEKIDNIKKYKTSGKVLDYKCNTGKWIEMFEYNGFEYLGIDESKDIIDKAKSYKSSGNYVNIPLSNTTFDNKFDNEFDIVHTNLQTTEQKEQEEILPKLYQSLKSDGIFVITEDVSLNKTPEFWISFIEKYGFKIKEKFHINEIGLEDTYLFIKEEKIKVELKKKEFLMQEIYNKIDMNDIWNSYLAIANKAESQGIGNDHSNINSFIKKLNEDMKYFPVDKYPDVLTLGCGDGGETKAFLDKGYNAIGVTLGKDNIKMAKDLYNINLIEADINILNFSPNSFNLIYMNHSFEHIFSPFINCLELWRVLKGEGRCHITVPNPDNTNVYDGLWHYNLLYDNQIKNMFEMCGFKTIEIYESGDIKNNTAEYTLIFEKLSISKISRWENYISYIHRERKKCHTTNLYKEYTENVRNIENDRHIDMNKWWNSYLAISNKLDSNGVGIDPSNLNDKSSSGLVYYVNEFSNNIPASKYPKVLDIGAGNGGETKVLIDKGYTVTGITLGTDNIKYAKENYNIDLLNMDMNHLDFISNSFDAVMMIQTFEHFLSSFIATIELWRVLRVGGLCYLDVPCPLDKPMWNLNHTNLLYADQIKNMFEMCGFKFVKQLSGKKEHRIRLIFEKLSISKVMNWNQLRYIHQLRNEA